MLFGTTLTRRLTVEIARVAALAFCALTGLLLILLLLLQGVWSGIDPGRLLRLAPILIAPTVPYTAPICLLLGCTVVFGRMAGNLELVALKASGVSLLRLMRPALMLAALVSGLTGFLADWVVPDCNRRVRELILEDVEGAIYALLAQRGRLDPPGLDYALFVERVEGRRLVRPIVHRRSGAETEMIVQARSARLSVVEDPAQPTGRALRLRLVDGTVSTGDGNAVHFHDRSEVIPVPDLIDRTRERASDLTPDRLAEKIDRRRQQQVAAQLALLESATLGPFDPRQAEKTGEELDRLDQEIRLLGGERHRRWGGAAAAIPFVILGVPLCVVYPRRDLLRTFFVCFVPILTLYYPAAIMAYNVWKESDVDVWAVLWLPSSAMIAGASPFLIRALKH